MQIQDREREVLSFKAIDRSESPESEDSSGGQGERKKSVPSLSIRTLSKMLPFRSGWRLGDSTDAEQKWIPEI